jgi:type II secretory pathway pseudopilin PulG
MRSANDSTGIEISGQHVPGSAGHARLDDRGYILVVLLVAMGVAAIWMSAALPAWRQQAMREKEIELIFRGEQYARAIALFQIKNNSYPVDIDVLVSQRYLRRKWKDPVTGQDFQLVGLTSGQGGQSGQIGAPNRVGGGIGSPAGGGISGGAGTTPASQPRPGANQPASPGRPGTTQMPAGGAGQRPTGGVPGGVPGGSASMGGQPLVGGITGVRSTSQATSIRVYNGQQQHNLWQFDASMMMARMGRNQMPGGGQNRGNDGRGRAQPVQPGAGRGGPPGGSVGAPRGGQPIPPPPPPPGGGRGSGSQP